MKTGEQTVEVVCAVIVGSISVSQLGKYRDYIRTEMAGQVPAHLATAVCDFVDQQVPRCLDSAAGEHQSSALQAYGLAAARDVFDTAHAPVFVVHHDARHCRFGE